MIRCVWSLVWQKWFWSLSTQLLSKLCVRCSGPLSLTLSHERMSSDQNKKKHGVTNYHEFWEQTRWNPLHESSDQPNVLEIYSKYRSVHDYQQFENAWRIPSFCFGGSKSSGTVIWGRCKVRWVTPNLWKSFLKLKAPRCDLVQSNNHMWTKFLFKKKSFLLVKSSSVKNQVLR